MLLQAGWATNRVALNRRSPSHRCKASPQSTRAPTKQRAPRLTRHPQKPLALTPPSPSSSPGYRDAPRCERRCSSPPHGRCAPSCTTNHSFRSGRGARRRITHHRCVCPKGSWCPLIYNSFYILGQLFLGRDGTVMDRQDLISKRLQFPSFF